MVGLLHPKRAWRGPTEEKSVASAETVTQMWLASIFL